MYELMHWPEADAALDQLECDPQKSAVLNAVERTLDRLADDPWNPRLGTVAFITEEYGGVCATPVRADDWYVVWRRGPEPHLIEIILVHPIHIA